MMEVELIKQISDKSEEVKAILAKRIV